ncbi:hypothetical protein FOCC_FOCC001085 [Frankliniella occidentalis]|nr:hypothetical protein FOCC_FOCC001085 [Frankliniella occidentalis]
MGQTHNKAPRLRANFGGQTAGVTVAVLAELVLSVVLGLEAGAGHDGGGNGNGGGGYGDGSSDGGSGEEETVTVAGAGLGMSGVGGVKLSLTLPLSLGSGYEPTFAGRGLLDYQSRPGSLSVKREKEFRMHFYEFEILPKKMCYPKFPNKNHPPPPSSPFIHYRQSVASSTLVLALLVTPCRRLSAVRLVQGPGKVLHEENSRTALTMTTSTKEARKVPQFLAAFAGCTPIVHGPVHTINRASYMFNR